VVAKTKTLVTCIDRDDDIGWKAGLVTPIIGKEALLSAATKLALADPEESDINAIFEAIRIYEQLRTVDTGVEPEVVLIAGDRSVGAVSDRKIGQKLDDVLAQFHADSAILVSDGAEDEWIIPIIQSRVKIDSVRRVVVKQIEPLENTFYVLKRLMEDPKISRTFLPPLGLILFLLAVSLLLNLSGETLGLILGIVGVYLMLKGTGRENLVIEFAESVKQSFYTGKISFVTYIVAVVLLLVGTSQGIMAYTDASAEIGEWFLLGMVYFIHSSIWWYIGAALAPIIGRMMSMVIEKERIVRHWAILFSIIASGLILWGGSDAIIWLSKDVQPMGYFTLFFSILGAILLSFIGVKLSLYMRGTQPKVAHREEAACVDSTEESVARE
jgi:putative membrane protein